MSAQGVFPLWLTGPGRPLTRFGELPRFKEGLYELVPRTYAWLVPNGSWGETNIGLIDCGGQSVLVDTCWNHRYTQEMLDAAASILIQSPVEHVVNTHADGDHCWGNQLFEGRQIIATQACIQQMYHHTPKLLSSLGAVAGALAHLPGCSLSRFGHYMHSMFAPYDFSGVRIIEPNAGFSGESVLNVNGVEIVLLEVGPGHTNGDAIVYIPSRRVVYAADILFVGSTPVMWAGPLENLTGALKRLMTLDVDVIVPGHGPLAKRVDVQRVIDYWDFIQEQLHPRMRHGMTAEQAARDVAMGDAFQKTQFMTWDSPERIMTNAYTLYRQWGAPLPNLPDKIGSMDLMRRQAGLAFELSNASPAIMRHYGRKAFT